MERFKHRKVRLSKKMMQFMMQQGGGSDDCRAR